MYPIFNEYSLNELYHIGTFNKKDKNDNPGYEGTLGISISKNPDGWRKIAQLSGDDYLLKKENPKFLDIHSYKSDEKNLEELYKWGKDREYIKETALYRYTYYDDEWSQEFTKIFENYQVALYESDEQEECITEEKGYLPTLKMKENMNLKKIEPTSVEDFLITLYFKEQENFDGIWWEDIEDISKMSLPRGLLFENKINTFVILKDDKSFAYNQYQKTIEEINFDISYKKLNGYDIYKKLINYDIENPYEKIDEIQERLSYFNPNSHIDESIYFLAFDKEKIVGMLHIKIGGTPSIGKPDMVNWLMSLQVDKYYQNIGIASKLIEQSFQYFDKKDVSNVLISSYEEDGLKYIRHKIIKEALKYPHIKTVESLNYQYIEIREETLKSIKKNVEKLQSLKVDSSNIDIPS